MSDLHKSLSDIGPVCAEMTSTLTLLYGRVVDSGLIDAELQKAVSTAQKGLIELNALARKMANAHQK